MIKQTQSFEHHAQLDYFLYALTLVAIVLWIGMGVVAHKVNSLISLNGLQYIMPIVLVVFLISLMMKMRTYATKLQDRIIRQEVQFRYYVATGNMLPTSITLSQMIGVRFAGDEEFVSLIDQVKNNPERTSKDVKRQVKNWKWDFNRV